MRRRLITTGLAVTAAATVLAAPAFAGAYVPDPNSYVPAVMAAPNSSMQGPKGISVDGFTGATANSASNTLTVFRTCQRWSCDARDPVTVPVGKQPSDVVVVTASNGSDGYAYSTGSGDGTLSSVPFAYDAPNYVGQASTVSIGGEPTGIAASSDGGTLYVGDKAGHQLLIVHAQTLTVTDKVAVGAGPWGVAASPDTRHVYVVDNEANAVSVVDLTTRSVAATIPVGSAPGAVAFDPSGAHAFVTNNGDGTVSIIDSRSLQVSATVKVGSQPWGVAANATHVFVANYGSGNVSVIDIAGAKVVATIATGSGSFGVALNDRYTVVVSNSGSNSVSTIYQSAKGPYVKWSSAKPTRTIVGVVPAYPAESYAIVARRGGATKKGSCALVADGSHVRCTVRVSGPGLWRASVTSQLPWQPAAYGAQNKRFTF
jgi:YVTN family beta-propeller protein